MPLFFVLLSIFQVVSHAGSSTMYNSPNLPNWYHSTEEVLEHFRATMNDCELAAVTMENFGANPVIPLFKFVGRANALQAAGRKPREHKEVAMLLFGEHARELISPETAIRMANDLCGRNGKVRDLAVEVLVHTIFHIVPVGNPMGRALVEGGNFCQRENENSVDLNRNWDDHWEAGDSMFGDTAPGSAAFSEPETRSFRDIAVKYPPTTFITIHSGTLGMYTPYAYSEVGV